jgi:hypothetical protein
LMALSGSITVGQVAPKSATKSRAGAGGSSVRTPSRYRPPGRARPAWRPAAGTVAARHAGRPPELISTGLPDARPDRRRLHPASFRRTGAG